MNCPECRSASVHSLGTRNFPYPFALVVALPLVLALLHQAASPIRRRWNEVGAAHRAVRDLDVQRTTDVNAAQGFPFVLRDEPIEQWLEHHAQRTPRRHRNNGVS